MTPIAPLEIRSVGEFMSYLEELTEDQYLFRGQHEDWPLTPKVARLKPTQGDLMSTERTIFSEFRRQALPWLEFRPDTAWDWLAVAQHHGLPTRLLDWSRNPLAALWFATNEPSTNGNHGVVWVLNQDSIPAVEMLSSADPLMIEQTRIFQPNHVARRIVSQAAFFTVHASTPSGGFVSLESEEPFASRLAKLTVPAAKFEQIRWDLDRCGFNAASVYPGLDGLCKHLQWLHTLASDERGVEAGCNSPANRASADPRKSLRASAR